MKIHDDAHSGNHRFIQGPRKIIIQLKALINTHGPEQNQAAYKSKMNSLLISAPNKKIMKASCCGFFLKNFKSHILSCRIKYSV